MRPPAAARSSDGWPATTPKEGTHTAVISAPPPMKGTRHPLRCPKPHNHKSRVHYPGSRPGLFVIDDVAIVVETKGKSMADQSRRGDITRLSRDLAATIGGACQQAKRLQGLIETN